MGFTSDNLDAFIGSLSELVDSDPMFYKGSDSIDLIPMPDLPDLTECGYSLSPSSLGEMNPISLPPQPRHLATIRKPALSRKILPKNNPVRSFQSSPFPKTLRLPAGQRLIFIPGRGDDAACKYISLNQLVQYAINSLKGVYQEVSRANVLKILSAIGGNMQEPSLEALYSEEVVNAVFLHKGMAAEPVSDQVESLVNDAIKVIQKSDKCNPMTKDSLIRGIFLIRNIVCPASLNHELAAKSLGVTLPELQSALMLSFNEYL